MEGVAGSTGVGVAFTAASVAACEAAGFVDFTMTALPGVVSLAVVLANFIEDSAAFVEATLEARWLPAHISMIGVAIPSRVGGNPFQGYGDSDEYSSSEYWYYCQDPAGYYPYIP